MGKIYLIRHGETAFNNGKRFQGQMNVQLSATGIQQAIKMSEFMKDKHIDVIYASPLLRAFTTAAQLAMAKNMPYKILDDLAEINFGDWEGKLFSEIYDQEPEEFDKFLTCPGNWTPPNGESFVQAMDRVKRTYAFLAEEYKHGKDIALVSHGGNIRLQLCMLLDIPINNMWKISINNVSVTTISDWDGNYIVESVNEFHFLGDLIRKGSGNIRKEV
ncbi:MAG: histidine phosphatase family protein [Phascolarctobacterium sp.]|nr:histidine phosphatase family protein [Phascolarctobacterium sp.]